MKTLLAPAIFALTILSTAPPAAAQATTDCSQTDPCLVLLSVDENGFQDDFQKEFTAGDWYAFNVSNFDQQQAHTVSLQGKWTMSLAAFDIGGQQKATRLDQAGCLELKDVPSNQVVKLRVYKADTNDLDAGVTTEADPCLAATGRTPGIEVPALGLAVVGAALLARRRL